MAQPNGPGLGRRPRYESEATTKILGLLREVQQIIHDLDRPPRSQPRTDPTTFMPGVTSGRVAKILLLLARTGASITTYEDIARLIDPKREVDEKFIKMIHVYIFKVRCTLDDSGIYNAIVPHSKLGYSVDRGRLSSVKKFCGERIIESTNK